MNETKLIIWDLDETLWQGTLAENDNVVLNQDVIHRIEFLLDRGIVHSICSKNDAYKAEKVLRQLGIYEYFIFPKISFATKGAQIKNIIQQTQLRAPNVLFVDDNEFILREALFHNPNMMIKLANQFMLEDVSDWGKNDLTRSRLAHYKILERKESNRINHLEKNNDERTFLKKCAINIQLTPLQINDGDIERVIELVNRSNQMNFTQSRIKYEYLFTLFELKNGLNFKIHVHDCYGDYGIVGYVCIINNALIHFVFSCRILGMCVESRVYQWLKANFPHIKSSVQLSRLNYYDTSLEFIKIVVQPTSKEKKSGYADKKILVRGPCLANAVSSLLNEQYQVDEEIFSFFEYANLNFLKTNMPNRQDPRFNRTLKAIENNEYQVLVNFLESDYYSGNYKIKNQLVPITSNYIFWQNVRSLKKENQLLNAHIKSMMLNGMRDIKKFNLTHRFSPWPIMEKIANLSMHCFGERWRKILYHLFSYFVFKNYCGFLSVDEFKKTITWYIALFPAQVQLIFINPPEHIVLPLMNEQQKYKIKQRTQLLNEVMRDIAKNTANVTLVEMDEILEQEDIIDNFSHLKRQGYIKLSQALLKTVHACGTTPINKAEKHSLAAELD